MLDCDKYDVMLDEYYELRSYDRKGYPSRERLEALGLKDVADDLEQRGSLGSGGASEVVDA